MQDIVVTIHTSVLECHSKNRVVPQVATTLIKITPEGGKMGPPERLTLVQ